MPCSRRAKAMLCLAVTAAIAGGARTSRGVVNVTVNNTVVGVTPRYLGLNMGHYMPNSNTTACFQYSGWGGKWEQWQFAYVMAYHAARDYDVQRFQWYNEPNQSSATISVADYTDRLRVTSDAIKAAVADVNRIYGKALVVDMSAPTAINGATNVDTWGAPVLSSNHTDLEGNTQAANIVATYD